MQLLVTSTCIVLISVPSPSTLIAKFMATSAKTSESAHKMVI